MPRPRATFVSLAGIPHYRRAPHSVGLALLCRQDRFSRRNFDLPQGRIAECISQHATRFAIDIAAHAVVSSLSFVVARFDFRWAMGWPTEEVLTRWTALFTRPLSLTPCLCGAQAETTSAKFGVLTAWRHGQWAT
jgi:hypothetical protein